MEITDTEIHQLAELSKLSFSADEIISIKKDLGNMIKMVNKLNELDTTGVKPLVHMSQIQNTMREDVVSGEITTAEALKNSPVNENNFFAVPKVVKK